MEAALYGPDGFYERAGGGAGRRGDFLTAPEVGPLFGTVLARALDAWWEGLGRPEGFTVVDAGAGSGALGRALAVAGCPHRYVAVDRALAQRARHDGLESVAELPTGPITGVVVANELLDNLPFDLALDGEPFDPSDRWPETGLVPVQDRARAWVEQASSLLDRGRVVVLDYCSTTESMAGRPWPEWLRTYRAHGRGGHPMEDLGEQDITCEVAVDQLPPPDRDAAQADWLRSWGIEDLVEEGRQVWRDRAHLGDLAAIRARSRVGEAEALTDPAGMGAFRVLEWVVGPQGRSSGAA